MNLDNRALLRSAGIGAAALAILGLLANVPVVGLICCCLLPFGYIGVGASYPYFAGRNLTGPTMLTTGGAALGGGIAAAIAGLVQGIVSGIASMLFFSSAGGTQAYIDSLEAAGVEVPPEYASMLASGGLGAGSILGAMCFGLVIGLVLGAIGGLIYNSMRPAGGTLPPAAPPPAV